MKYILMVTTLMMLALSSCKTTQDNWQKAYLTAKDKTEQDILTDANGNKVANLLNKKVTSVDGDTVNMISGRYILMEGATENYHTYNVVVGTFRNEFTATSLYTRLLSHNLPALLLRNYNKDYYVVAKSFSQKTSEMANLMKNFSKLYPVPIEKEKIYMLIAVGRE